MLLQNERPVAYASKAFTDSEKNYAQIEKELAAVVFGVERFHQYVFMRNFVVETDHKPLETIIKKSFADTPPRLQRMLLKLQKYDLTLQYKKGTLMHVADALSRDFSPLTENDDNQEDVVICMVDCLPMTPERVDEMQRETMGDRVLQKLKAVVQEGWPANRSNVDPEVCMYWDYRDEITIEENLLFKQGKVIIPAKLRKLMLTTLHRGHQGIEKTKRFCQRSHFLAWCEC